MWIATEFVCFSIFPEKCIQEIYTHGQCFICEANCNNSIGEFDAWRRRIYIRWDRQTDRGIYCSYVQSKQFCTYIRKHFDCMNLFRHESRIDVILLNDWITCGGTANNVTRAKIIYWFNLYMYLYVRRKTTMWKENRCSEIQFLRTSKEDLNYLSTLNIYINTFQTVYFFRIIITYVIYN